jgi:hypothetical protein
MTLFFLDLWHDLREKRLWPVAVGLLAAIIAVPVILFKPASDAAPPATVIPKTNGAQTLPVVAVESGPTVGSKLEAYSEKNPFKPMKDLEKTAQAPGSDGTSSADTGSGATGADSGSSLGNPGGDTSSGGGTSPSTGGTSPSDTTPGTTPITRWFRTTADFSFGEPGKEETFKDQANFTMLPDEATASIVYMGVSADHKHAVFFISDPGIQAQGEGKCNATGADCRFVTLSIKDSGDEETFTAVDGSVSYNLKLLKFNRQNLDTDSNGNPVSPPNGKAQVATGAGVAAATDSTQSVVPELFGAGPGLLTEEK